uniref:TSA: Wollemia nobilis Ref_Wollemi_Transcript_18637_1149 transcribed RNA sequence n=1 Tax=Wollemia nobilis TaxID=56998 RepID=A0A0C9QND9_9CONI
MDSAVILSDKNKEEENIDIVGYPLDLDKDYDNCEIGEGNNSSEFSSDFIHECNWVHDVVFMCDSLVCRFTCIKPSVQDLCNWSKKHWGPKLRSIWTFEALANGFFKVNFLSQLDCKFVMDNGPWFMGSAGLSLKCWSPDFDPKNPGPMRTPIWVKLLYFPCDYWFQCNLIKVCAAVGKVLKISEVSKKKRSLIARVCVEVDPSKKLPSTISLCYHGVVYTGVLRYEGIPFRCKVCHSADHREGCCSSKNKKVKKYIKIGKDGKEPLRKSKHKKGEMAKNGGTKDLPQKPQWIHNAL